MLKIRTAVISDCPLILDFIKEIADYEKLSHEVTADVATLEKNLFIDKHGAPEVFIGEYENKPVCYAIIFHNFSSFLGKKGIYLEDLYVKPEMRGKGFGKEMLMSIFRLAKERGCGRVEWSVLDWNTPAIEFYKSLGAVPMDGWTVYRMTEASLAAHN